MDEKLVIKTTGEKLLLGNDIIELKDQTRETFETDNPEDMKEYLLDNFSKCDIYIKGLGVDGYIIEKADYDTKPAALCRMAKHPVVELLKQYNSKQIDLADFSVLLERLKNYMTSEALAFKDNIQDLKIKKILSLENRSDRRGNYSFTIKAESGGKEDYIFPKKIKLMVPVIKSMPGTAQEIEFDFYFQWKAEEQNIELKFTIENFEFDQIIDEDIKKILDGIFQDENIKIYHGSLSIHKQTNSWMYHKNDLAVKGI